MRVEVCHISQRTAPELGNVAAPARARAAAVPLGVNIRGWLVLPTCSRLLFHCLLPSPPVNFSEAKLFFRLESFQSPNVQNMFGFFTLRERKVFLHVCVSSWHLSVLQFWNMA